MVFLDNRTPFAAELFTLLDGDAQEVNLLVIAASFVMRRGGKFEPELPQPPVCMEDEFNGDPEFSSLRREADVALHKPRVDVIVNGSAHAPRGSECRQVVAELHVADIEKRLVVTGDRRRFWLPFWLGAPAPFTRMPIRYERAYGGTHGKDPKRIRMHRPNPVGVGFRSAASSDPLVQTDAANISHGPGAERSVPAGFGMIGRSWTPRIDFAGTYDDAWQEHRWPLLPEDFDTRYNQCAPPDQQSGTIRGGESVRLVNLNAAGEWKFRLPKLVFPVRLVHVDRVSEVAPRLDTVIIEPDEARVVMSLRIALPIDRSAAPLREVILGHVTRSWLMAREKGKRYVDPHGGDGSDPSLANFE